MDLRTALSVTKEAAADRKAIDTEFLDMTGVVDYLDVMCITSGETAIQNRAIADRIAERLKEYDIIFASLQGYRDGSWIVLDYSWMVVHVMLPQIRTFYRLEELWSEGKKIDI
ncbi:MAG: ribosome silencing factor [Candidatus Riflebacteria bacterium RBG_13_59_9]|nr:MAG: ribosome silencing factor [Candidatus Riflebacteria bacterium RBG_13_59_9]